MMKTTHLPFYFIFLFGISTCFAQSKNLENNLRKADELWKNKQISESISQYKSILSTDSVPEEWKSLIYLRLAKAQFTAHLNTDCKATLAKAKNLAVLPAHHQLMVTELEQQIDGVNQLKHTAIPIAPKSAATIYVSAIKANEKKSGQKKIVYANLNLALKAVSQLMNNKYLPEGTIEIIVEGKSYELTEPIKLNAKNSGTKRNPLLIRSSAATEQVTLNGGRNLKNWKRESDPQVLLRLPKNAKSKVRVASFEDNQISGLDSLTFGGFSSARSAKTGPNFTTFPVPELFNHGIPQKMARWPNNRDTLIALKDFKSERTLRWAADQDVWLHGYWFHLWADAYEKFKGYSAKDSIIELVPPTNFYGFAKSKWHVVNALSELDTPGEWCISLQEKKIWYFPKTKDKLDQMVLSLQGPAIQAQGCDYLTIKGLNIQYVRGDGMLFQDCNHLTLANCSISNSSGLGIKIKGGSDQLIHSCTIKSMGRGGIDINVGDQHKLISSGSVIENCSISNLSRVDRTYTPAIVLDGVGIKVRNCKFKDIPSSGIRLEGNDMLVELNEFENCVSESDDQGAIDVWGNPLFRGNVIRWNFFKDIGVPNLRMAAGVRLDDAICGFGIYENLFLRSSNNLFGGVQIHGGKDNFIEGNIFADCHAAISQSLWGDKRWTESINDTVHPMYKAMHTTEWQSDLWQNRYPALKNLLTNADINFASDNLAINAQSLTIRTSKRFEILNNQLLKTDNHPSKPIDYKPYLVPWHSIPVDQIGTY
ncbi:MAG: right-handed parallel beta-helix repeat-containing protein [Bacteroidia bacterium]|nr:right-handed parallel beta-helix repeat-containing protein [Bacteroidia bacterium]